MANYIGNAPVSGEFKHLDSIASQFNGSTTTFTLLFNGVSQSVGDASQLIVSLNGVVQEPLTAYTLGTGGSTVIFSSAPASGSTCFIVKLGGVGGTTTPSDNSVTTAKIASGAITSAKLDTNITVSGTANVGSYVGSVVNSPLDIKADTSHFGLSIEENNGTETWQLGVDVDGDLNFHNSGSATPSVTFNDAGNVGIGEPNPTDPLVVKSSGASMGGGATLTNSYFTITDGTTSMFHDPNELFSDINGTFHIGATHSNGALRFQTGGTDARMDILANGNVGIGTSSPAQLLEVSGNGKKSRFTRSGSAGTLVQYYYGSNPAGGIQVQSTGLGIGGAARENDLFIKNDGNVGIGTDTNLSNSEWHTGSRFLTIDGTAGDAYGILSLRGDRDNTGTSRAFQIGAGDGKLYLAYDDNNNDHRVVVFSDGDVCVGQGASAAQGGNYGANLHVRSTGTGSSLKLTDSTSGHQTTSGFELISTGLAGYIWNREAAKLSFATSNLERAVIDANGKVILGGADSTIGSNNVLTINNDGNNATYPAIALQNTNIGTGNSQGMWLGILGAGSNIGRGYVWNYENQPLWFGTNSAARQIIQADGNISIGANAEFTPSGRVHIKGGNGDQLILDNAGERFTQISLRENDTQNGALWLDSTDNRVDLYANTNHGIRFKTGGDNTRVTIGSNGDVDINSAGIGAGNTGAGLKVQSITSNSGAIAARSQSHNNVFGVLPWSSGRTYLSSGTHYENSTWKAQNTGGMALLSFGGEQGVEWWAGNGSADGAYDTYTSDKKIVTKYGLPVNNEQSYCTGWGSGARTDLTTTSWVTVNTAGTNSTGARLSGSNNVLEFTKIDADSDLIVSVHFPFYMPSASNGLGIRIRIAPPGSNTYAVDQLTDGPGHGWGAGGYGGDTADILNYTWNTENFLSNTGVGTVKLYFEMKVWSGSDTAYVNMYQTSYNKYGYIHVREVSRLHA